MLSFFLGGPPMIRSRFVLAAATLAALAAIASPAQARRHIHHAYAHGYAYGLPYPISYSHNYGPGPEPGTFAYYDGPSNNFCAQGSATYDAQGGRYPCF
jgi:hypothetical protein